MARPATPAPARITGFATDQSAAALEVARTNAEKHAVLDRLTILEGDLLAPVKARLGPGERLDLVVSNPPYVLPSEKPALAPELAFEPQSALFDAGEDLPLTRRLAIEARELLAPGGLLIVETGAERAALVREHFERAGLVEVQTRRDLAGHERFVRGRAPRS